MADAAATKHLSFKGGILVTELRSLRSLLKSKRTVSFAYGFMFCFVLFTVFLAFSPSNNSSSPWFVNMFSTGSATATAAGSQFSSIFSYFSPNNNYSTGIASPQQQRRQEKTNDLVPVPAQNATINRSKPVEASQSTNTSTIVKSPPAVNYLNQSTGDSVKPTVFPPKQSKNSSIVSEEPLPANSTTQNTEKSNGDKTTPNPDQTTAASKAPVPSNQSTTSNSPANQTTTVAPKSPSSKDQTAIANSPTKSDSLETKNSGNQENSIPAKSVASNYTASLAKKQSDETKQSNATNTVLNQGLETLVDKLLNCDLFDGHWVKDETYPLYKPGSCSLIDEQFNCIINGRPDKDYQKYKWKPKACTLPRLNPAHMLELLRGKRLAFVGDSLNRNMWESLVCMLRGSAKNPSNVYEANGRQHFRGEASYSFIFKDYGCSVEFFVTPFLVQEWEVHDKNGSTKETLRLDLIGKTCSLYKNADIIVFNTGHWWTHDKTSKGKDYYQEGSHVYDELNVLEAFRKALTTWGRWVDANIDPAKSLIFFRGYSDSHFSGGQWNSGGACDSEVEPIKNETYLREYPPKMLVLERVLRGMKTHVTYMNITQMTDYRKDGHPSIYRKHNLTEEERRSPLRYQDCSHWCLPGVPDAWNEILYAELLINVRQKQQAQKRHR